jgi:hypothetical protein
MFSIIFNLKIDCCIDKINYQQNAWVILENKTLTKKARIE